MIRQVTKTRQVTGDNKIERNEDQQVAAGDVDTLAVITQKKGHPGDQDNHCDRRKDAQPVVLRLARGVDLEFEARTRVAEHLALL
jgi:hypothetical protein